MRNVRVTSWAFAVCASAMLSAGPAMAAKSTKKAAPKPAAAAAPAPAPDAAAPAAPAPDAANKVEAPADGSAGADEQAIRMRGLEEKVNDLKEKIFRSKARLMLLRETVLNGAIAGAKATLVHDNQMGSAFILESINYALDGAPIYSKVDKDDKGELDAKKNIELFSGSIVPGNHNISVQLVFIGNGYGVFSYLKGYKFRMKSSYAFTAEEGKNITVRVVAYEKGGITTDLQDRPAVRYDVDVKSDVPPTGATPVETKPAS